VATACIAIEPATVTVDATPALITLDAITSGAGIGNSPNRGILKVATISDETVSLVFGRFRGTVGGCPNCISSAEDFSSSSDEDV
tara:strand:+ start:430 stop:684 length:255 start_codon:yes stop_codon:yes gene_type:complete